MIEMLRSTLELCVIIPGLLIAYFPVKSSARQSLPKLISWIVPLFLILSIGGGLLCYTYRILTMPILALITLLAVVVYMKTLKISVWKSVTIGLSVCAVFACLKSVSRAINAAILTDLPNAQMDPWLCLQAVICYNALCWIFAVFAWYPATHAVRKMVKDDNFPQTWYSFWALPFCLSSIQRITGQR